jgi:hypothetical protein
MNLLKLTHANFHRTVYINPAHIAGLYYSDSHKATHIVSVGAIFPVTEPLDEVIRLLTNRASDGPGPKEGQQNGI